MTTAEKLTLYRKFDEGTEISDAIHLLIRAALVLNGISADHELGLVMLTIEKMIRDYMEMGRARNLDWEDYKEIDPELYSFVLGGANKLSIEQFQGDLT